jgi:hypothetical protein
LGSIPVARIVTVSTSVGFDGLIDMFAAFAGVMDALQP